MHHDYQGTSPAAAPKDRRGLAVLLAAIPVLVIVVWLGTQAGGDPTAPPTGGESAATAAQFTWRAGDERTYALHVDRTIQQGQAAPATKASIRAQLCLRVLDSKASRATVAMQLRNLSHQSEGVRDATRERALGLPFVVAFDGAMPTQFEFAASLTAGLRAELEEFVRTFQATLPTSADTSWHALEEHDAGTYRAAYSRRPFSPDLATVWNKHKAAYLPGRQGTRTAGQSIRIFASKATLTLQDGTSWWHRADVTEDVELSLLGKPFARATTHSVLQAQHAAIDPAAEIVRVSGPGDLRDVPSAEGEEALQPVAPRPEDVAQFASLMDKWIEGGGKNFNLVHALAAMLKQFPELAPQMLPHLANPDLQGPASAGLVHALELAGNDACQDTLGTVCALPNYPHDNRKRAIIGLSGIKAPSESSIDTLWRLSKTVDPDGGEQLAHTAILALGSAAHNLKDTDAKRASDVSLGLQAKLQNVATNERTVVLSAIYNTHDDTLLPAVRTELQSDNRSVRTAAAMAISGMDSPDAFATLYDRAQNESDTRVRAAIIDGMDKQSHKSDAAFRECTSWVQTERDPQVRKSLARYLANNLDHYPAARKVLQDIMNDKRTNQQLRSYLVKNLFSRKTSSRRSLSGR